MERRADLIAAGKRIQAAEALLPAAKDQLRRRVNLDLSIGYSGLLEKKNIFSVFGAPFKNPAGPNATASIQYYFTRENSAARGALLEAEANYRQTLLARSNIERIIANSVASSMVDLVKSIARLQEARESIRQYQLALEGEQDKYRLGQSALLDVLTMEERLTAANSDEVSAQLDYAIAVQKLRFATGSMIDPRSSAHTLDRQLFVTPPFDWEQP
jgi:outer membrane protein TolC